MHRLKSKMGKKPQTLDFYTDLVVSFARMKICFLSKVNGFYHKKF